MTRTRLPANALDSLPPVYQYMGAKWRELKAWLQRRLEALWSYFRVAVSPVLPCMLSHTDNVPQWMGEGQGQGQGGGNP